ncbi:MAG: DUF1592 domain-containing protein [Verrucomicrobia bacterium]|nr:DUF1592 domain-containing protein [Verrucomicrobiota bacterium]
MSVRQTTAIILCALGGAAALWFFGGELAGRLTGKRTRKVSFQKEVQPLFARYCYDCHGEKKKGDLDLRVYADETAVLKDRQVFAEVLKNVSNHIMPPKKKPQPTPAERQVLTRWLNETLFACDCSKPDPGRVTLRRLNRVEYNNTIRDLLGVAFQPADDFPADDIGYGFDNIGDVLSLPPILFEKYLAAAEKILSAVLVTEDPAKPRKKTFPALGLEATASVGTASHGWLSVNREGEVFVPHRFPAEGDYILRVHAYGQQAGPEPVKMALRLEGEELKVFEVTAVEARPQLCEVKTRVSAGTKRFAAAYLNNYTDPKNPDPKQRDHNLIVEYLEIEGPLNAKPQPLPETHERIFICQPTPATKTDCARRIIGHFAQRAFRRPVQPEEVARLVKFVELAEKEGENFETGIKLALEAVLVSPHFIFRGELQPDPNNASSVHPIDEYALASRLSYFLWSTMPDDELFAEAERGTLRKNLEKQVRRMLRDPKARALVENFAGQWLQLRSLKVASPDLELFPEFDEALRAAMQRETELFIEQIVAEDRRVLDFLDADYTFVNERLAWHYGLAGVKGDEFRRVSLKGTPRGGILTHGSILTITSNPTRTSPVKRGKWVLENFLGTVPPPPPPDVPELKETELTGTLRQRMEQHRENPTCASCHALMDPIGFGFENFDAIGAWRRLDGESPVDPTGTLVTGESFKGVNDLRTILARRKRDEFARCLAEKTLTYALGRGLEYYDKCALDQITKGLKKRDYKFSALVLEVVKSTPFQMRRGEAEKLARGTP